MSSTLQQSTYRTVVWTPALEIPVPADGTLKKLPLRWVERSAISKEDFTLDLSWWLNDQGDTLLTLDSSMVTPNGGLTDMLAISPTIEGPLATVILTGGVMNTEYVVGLMVTTGTGRQELFSVSILVNSDSPNTIPTTGPLSTGITSGGIDPLIEQYLLGLPETTPDTTKPSTNGGIIQIPETV